MAFLDENGVSRLWQNFSAKLNDKIVPKLTTVSLAASGWALQSEGLYAQTATVNGSTIASKIDIQLTAAQIISLSEGGFSLMAENNNGTVTFYAIGNMPTNDYNLQILITEVNIV